MNAATRGMPILVMLAALPAVAQAEDVRRACRATGYFVYTFQERTGDSVVTHTQRIDILQSDMEVVASSAGQMWNTVTDAKRWACSQAASCYVRLASGAAASCGDSPLNTIYETTRMPSRVNEWRRDVACNHARAGNVEGVGRTGRNTVTLLQTRIVATASRDGITRHADRSVNESNHLCWKRSRGDEAPSPSPKPPPGRRPSRTTPDGPPTRTDPDRRPSRTDSSHRPSRTDGSHRPGRTDGPSPIASMRVTVTPQEQKGRCPASVLMQARLALSRPVEVRWWVTGEDGYQSPKYVRSFTRPEASLVWRRHIDPQASATQKTMTMQGGGAPKPVHQGYFQLHLETAPKQGRSISLGESERVPFTVDCNPEAPDRFERQP